MQVAVEVSVRGVNTRGVVWKLARVSGPLLLIFTWYGQMRTHISIEETLEWLFHFLRCFVEDMPYMREQIIGGFFSYYGIGWPVVSEVLMSGNIMSSDTCDNVDLSS